MDKKSSWLACLLLSSSLLGNQCALASAEEFDSSVGSSSSQGLKPGEKFDYMNVFSAVSAVDVGSFEPPKNPKSLRGTWQAYDPDLVQAFWSGDLKIIDPALVEKNTPWSELSEAEKQGISAISIMYEQNKAQMKENDIITEEEASLRWEDLSGERQASLPVEWLLPSREGLAESRGVGCAQFNKDQLLETIKFIEDHDDIERAKTLSDSVGIDFEGALETVRRMREAGALKTWITIVDHREEPHLHLEMKKAVGNSPVGLIFSDETQSLPMSLYAPGDAFSKGKSNLKVEAVEGRLIQSIQDHEILTLSLITEKDKGMIRRSETQTYNVERAYSEKDLAHDLGLGYGRVPITDHNAIEDEDGDYLRLAFDGIPQGAYAIHHCRGGKGRTETGLTTRDMMFNHDKNLSLVDFVLRHVLIGGPNLLGPLVGDPSKEWKKPQAFERAKGIARFYRYTRETKEGVRVLYREWLKSAL